MIASALILAHAGHWFAGLLYLAPVLIVVGALLYQSWKDKREGPDEDEDGEVDGEPERDVTGVNPPPR